MVTMRRDVAVTKNVSGYDALTAYDKFIMKKNARRNDEVQEKESKSAGFFERLTFAPNKREEKKTIAVATETVKPVAGTTETSYDKYLLNCLQNKRADERVLSSEEFYESLLSGKQSKPRSAKVGNEKKETGARAKKEARPERFTKFGKIILSVYVLVALLTAFTLVAVNVFNSEPVLADAEENPTLGAKTIRPMTTETLEKEEESWFDSLCDAVKK